jgi:hypothetical protein
MERKITVPCKPGYDQVAAEKDLPAMEEGGPKTAF